MVNLLDKQLLMSVAEGDVDEVMELLESGADVNAVAEETLEPFIYQGDSVLMVAAQAGHVECLMLLLEDGADVNFESVTRTTALFGACLKGRMECVLRLLDYGADVNFVAPNGQTPLSYMAGATGAARAGIVKALLDYDADFDFVDDDGNTPLMNAYRHSKPIEIERSTEVINMLLQRGADISVVNKAGKTLMDILSDHPRPDGIEFLKFFFEEQTKINAQFPHYLKWVNSATSEPSNKHPEVVKALNHFFDRAAHSRDVSEDYREMAHRLRSQPSVGDEAYFDGEAATDSVTYASPVGERVFQVFDQEIYRKIYARGAGSDRDLQKLLRELNPHDDGHRLLQRVTPEFIGRINQLKDDYPNMIPYLSFVERQAALSIHNKYGEMYMPPVLLVSKPGLGKTACVKEVAQALSVPFDFVDFSTASAAWVLVGVSSVWQGSKPGMIFDQLVKGSVANGFILCDEIDKARGHDKHEPINVFYRLLEKDMMTHFDDEYLSQLKLNASRMMFVATANDIKGIPDAILSRFHLIEIKEPSREQMQAIIDSIYRSILVNEEYRAFSCKLSEEVVRSLIGYTPRQIKVSLKLAFGNAAFRTQGEYEAEIAIEVADLEFPRKTSAYPIGFVHGLED